MYRAWGRPLDRVTGGWRVCRRCGRENQRLLTESMLDPELVSSSEGLQHGMGWLGDLDLTSVGDIAIVWWVYTAVTRRVRITIAR